MLDRQQTGIVFNVQKFSVHDGEGIRTLVFLKGCPLHCPWCSNPESQRREPERAYNPTRCLTAAVCGRCAKACPTGAVSIVGGLVCFDRSKCTGCNACVRACPSGAQTVYGETQSVDQILSRVEEDGVFYTRSGGGLTLSGGEALAQPDFALALLRDSTNSERPGFTATEQKVAAGVRNLFARARNKRIIIATFASNIYRVQQIIDLAVEDGRKVAFSGRSMVNNTAMAQELGYMHIPEGTLISVDELNQYPPEQVVLITTGSQGEPLSALSRMASCSHRQVRVGPGDFIIISANPIPGNEKSVTKIVNGLLLLGAEVIYESMYDVHVSGHACQEEQKLMLTLTKPKYFLPVHGEYKQLKKHALTAASLGIPTSNILIAENGSNVILSQDEIKLGEPVTAGAVMVDGLGVGDVGNVVLRDRKHLSEDGLVIIVATVDSKTGKVLAGPDLVSRGFVYVRENESLMDGAQSIVENALDRCVDEHVRDWNSVKTRVREALSSYIYRRTKRSPMILPILMEV